jgi:hypothetical protein
MKRTLIYMQNGSVKNDIKKMAINVKKSLNTLEEVVDEVVDEVVGEQIKVQ